MLYRKQTRRQQDVADERSVKPSSNMLCSGMSRGWLILAIVAVLGVLGMFYAGMHAVRYFNNPGQLEKPIEVIIEPGTSLNTVSHILEDKQVIKQPLLFSLMVRLQKMGNRIQAGQYLFQPYMTPKAVYEQMAMGKVMVHQLTVPEGLMTFQVLELIKSAPYLEGDVPDQIKEGTLLPETYSYHYKDTRAALVKRMQVAMQQTLDELWQLHGANQTTIKNAQEHLTLASIIEKETGVSSERTRVAAVFVNRLKKNMKLQTDPTVIYAITQGKYVLDRPLLLKDLEKDNPYNTYTRFGLPPGPIANPGKASLEAALTPAKTNALYFVANGTGGHAFSHHLEGHNKNVLFWRNVQRQQQSNPSLNTARPSKQPLQKQSDKKEIGK